MELNGKNVMNLQNDYSPARGNRIPGGEQIKRLLRETGHISRMLSSYSCEPTTERQFHLRTALRERLRAFEMHCKQGKGHLGLSQLLREFAELESEARKYVVEVRH